MIDAAMIDAAVVDAAVVELTPLVGLSGRARDAGRTAKEVRDDRSRSHPADPARPLVRRGDLLGGGTAFEAGRAALLHAIDGVLSDSLIRAALHPHRLMSTSSPPSNLPHDAGRGGSQ